MTAATGPGPDWLDRNLASLDSAVARVRFFLDRALMQRMRTAAIAPAAVEEPPRPGAPDGYFALDALRDRFGLDPFELDLVVLVVAAEISAEIAQLCAQLQPDRGQVTFGLALAVLPGAHWTALRPDSPLRGFDLIELDGGEGGAGLALRRLKAAEPVIHFLLGAPSLDPALAAILDPVEAAALWPSHAGAAGEAARLATAPVNPIVHLTGRSEAVAGVAAAASAMCGTRLLHLDSALLAADPAALDLFRRRWNRDSLLNGAALLIECGDLGGRPGAAASILQLCARAASPIFLTGDLPAGAGGNEVRPVVRIDLPPAAAAESRAAWRDALGQAGLAVSGPLAERLSDQFRVAPDSMAALAAAAAAGAAAEGPDREAGARLWQLCRVQGRGRLEGLAARIEGKARLDDVVLQEEAAAALRQIVARHRNRARVLDSWNMGREQRGRGLSALFTGPSGTGKTLAAEAVANALELDLYRIDLASIVDKYVGETEKNLRRVFDAAEDMGAVLLFDEADALFSRRGDVKDSRDRSDNLEIGYLLQRIEAYSGIAVLTSNLPGAIDPAFLRRFAYVVAFGFPAEAQRRALWQRAFPSAAPTFGIDLDRLARLPLSGGQVSAVAMNAAFAAADSAEPIGMVHVGQAIALEFAKRNLPSPLAMMEAPE
jgi:hypothetical protein